MTLQHIAQKLNVSTATVSRALNPATEHLISPRVRKKIQAYASQLRFTPNPAARQLLQGRSFSIGVVLSTAFNSFFFNDQMIKVQAGLYAELEQELRYGCKLMVLPRGKPISEADRHVLGAYVDGLLVSALSDFSADRLHELAASLQRRWKKPIVALNLVPQRSSPISTVSFNNREAAYKAVRHLIQNGHEKIALIYADNGSWDAQERVAGFKNALADHHLSSNPDWHQRGDFSAVSGYQAVLELFKQPEASKVTAIFCMNDEMAIGALKGLKALHKRCPQDVAVMGFDGLAVGELMEPRLSTIPQPSYEIAKAGMKLLLDLVEGRQKGPVHLTVPTEVLIRDSA
jgi:DNA-binding LacI/PurR family transcriptional regulator